MKYASDSLPLLLQGSGPVVQAQTRLCGHLSFSCSSEGRRQFGGRRMDGFRVKNFVRDVRRVVVPNN
jgi:small ligand-binding sensory domain FIST